MSDPRKASGIVESDAAVERVLERLEWMREREIWPNGPRYLWTDAFGVVLLLPRGGDRPPVRGSGLLLRDDGGGDPAAPRSSSTGPDDRRTDAPPTGSGS